MLRSPVAASLPPHGFHASGRKPAKCAVCLPMAAAQLRLKPARRRMQQVVHASLCALPCLCVRATQMLGFSFSSSWAGRWSLLWSFWLGLAFSLLRQPGGGLLAGEATQRAPLRKTSHRWKSRLLGHWRSLTACESIAELRRTPAATCRSSLSRLWRQRKLQSCQVVGRRTQVGYKQVVHQRWPRLKLRRKRVRLCECECVSVCVRLARPKRRKQPELGRQQERQCKPFEESQFVVVPSRVDGGETRQQVGV